MSEEPTLQQRFDAALDALPMKQRRFVEEFLTCLNKTEAARRAGYADPNRNASRLTVVNGIQTAISLGLALAAMPTDEVLARLADMARSTADDFITVYESPLHDVTGEPVLDKEGKPIVRYWPSLDLEKARERGVLHLVKKVTHTAHGPSVELYDAQAALVKLGEYHKLFGSKNINVNLTPDQAKELTDEELDAELKKRGLL